MSGAQQSTSRCTAPAGVAHWRPGAAPTAPSPPVHSVSFSSRARSPQASLMRRSSGRLSHRQCSLCAPIRSPTPLSGSQPVLGLKHEPQRLHRFTDLSTTAGISPTRSVACRRCASWLGMSARLERGDSRIRPQPIQGLLQQPQLPNPVTAFYMQERPAAGALGELRLAA